MGKFLKIINHDSKYGDSLQRQLIRSLYENFNLRLKLKLGHLKKLHLLKKVRHDINSIKFRLSHTKNSVHK